MPWVGDAIGPCHPFSLLSHLIMIQSHLCCRSAGSHWGGRSPSSLGKLCLPPLQGAAEGALNELQLLTGEQQLHRQQQSGGQDVTDGTYV